MCHLVHSVSCHHLYTGVPPQTLIVGRTLPYNFPASPKGNPINVLSPDLGVIANYKGLNTGNIFVSYDRVSPYTLDY
jgi:hypothetical protein